jgi:purine-binding chemotaxis protein CheW
MMSLSSSPNPRQDDRKILQFVGFRLEDTDYAVAITRVREIIVMRPITRVPQVPPYIEGLINLRGSVIPIVNLRTRLGLPGREFDEETRMIVATLDDRTMGLIVDAVTEIVRIAADQIQPAPIAVATIDRRHLAGVARWGERLLVLLDLDHLLEGDDPNPNSLLRPSSTVADS